MLGCFLWRPFRPARFCYRCRYLCRVIISRDRSRRNSRHGGIVVVALFVYVRERALQWQARHVQHVSQGLFLEAKTHDTSYAEPSRI